MLNTFSNNFSVTNTSRAFYCSAIYLLAICAAIGEEVQPEIDFNRQIRPILSDKCFQCHGPDPEHLQAGLRLDLPESAHHELGSGTTAIVPGDLAASELVYRITADDESMRMPPIESQKSLTEEEKTLLKQWIAEGGQYKPHWSFIPPRRPPVPELAKDDWSRGAIDRFVLRRLRSENLHPSLQADRRTLIRRVSFDLTGLPPTISEVDAFLADNEPGAYERVVDRLLASARYGERMAVHWLDLARYADSDGYEKDGHRDMWPYRDWVIHSFNYNQPFDEFTIEQLAGDMLPGATRDQKIASAFNRNNPTTSEAGSDPNEYAAKYAVDRVSTTSVVWLGLTMQCAECHDHKFDPITTEDFYRLFAFFNQIPEIPLYEGTDCPPIMAVPTPEQEKKLSKLEDQISTAHHELEFAVANLVDARSEGQWREALVAEYLFDEKNDRGSLNTANAKSRGVVRPISSAPPDGESLPRKQSGIAGTAWRFDGNGMLECDIDLALSFSRGFSYGAWVKPTQLGGVVLCKSDATQNNRGFDLYLQGGKALVHLIDAWPERVLKVTSRADYVPDEWLHVFVAWDGHDDANSIRLYFNGVQQEVTADIDTGTIESLENMSPLRIGSRAGGESAFHGLIDEVRVFDRPLSSDEITALVGRTIRQLMTVPVAERDDQQLRLITSFCQESFLVPATASQRSTLTRLEQAVADIRDRIPKLRIMQQLAERRPTHILVRGDYRNRGKEVTAAIPAVLGTLPDSKTANRLALARWITSDDNPLTARVVVNRFWAMFFGHGIVDTPNDFGSQGEWPSHPELLDWLATEFVESGWDVKALLRQIVTSRTYRQSSAVVPALLERDPQNRLLARGPRHRLPAEMIRDNSLAVSGLLEENVGGPSVYPYHPAGLWEEMAWADSPWKTWPQSKGSDLYRRSLYTFWKRSILHPVMSVFDAPNRNVCEAARSATNTPLQAFATLNERSFVESARALAARMMHETSGDPATTISHGYMLAVARLPSPQERDVMLQLYREMYAHFENQPEKATALQKVCQSDEPTELDPIEIAAWTTVAQVLLNLDETMTKE